MSEDPNKPEIERETLRGVGGAVTGGTGGMPAPGGTGGIVLGGTGGITLLAGGTGGFPAPGGTGGIVMGGTGGVPLANTTAILGPDGTPRPGRYRVETRHVAEFEVLENGHVVVHRTATEGGTPEAQ